MTSYERSDQRRRLLDRAFALYRSMGHGPLSSTARMSTIRCRRRLTSCV